MDAPRDVVERRARLVRALKTEPVRITIPVLLSYLKDLHRTNPEDVTHLSRCLDRFLWEKL